MEAGGRRSGPRRVAPRLAAVSVLVASWCLLAGLASAEEAEGGAAAGGGVVRAPARACFGAGPRSVPSVRDVVTHTGVVTDRPPEPSAAFAAKARATLAALPGCTVLTRSCVKGSARREFGDGAAGGAPDLAPGSLGTCALVGAADTVLGLAAGAEIDAHDTVVRFNTPMRGFEGAVGARTDAMWMKHDYAVRGEDEGKEPDRFYILTKSGAKGSLTRKGKQVLVVQRVGATASIAAGLYKEYVNDRGLPKTKRRRPSTGLRRVLSIIASGLCSRVDLYGFSSGGGKYWARSTFVKGVHMLYLEHFLYRVMMEEGKVCVFGD